MKRHKQQTPSSSHWIYGKPIQIRRWNNWERAHENRPETSLQSRLSDSTEDGEKKAQRNIVEELKVGH